MGTRSNSNLTLCDTRRRAHERCKDHIAGRERPEHDVGTMTRSRGVPPPIRTRIGSWRASTRQRGTRRSGPANRPRTGGSAGPGQLRNHGFGRPGAGRVVAPAARAIEPESGPSPDQGLAEEASGRPSGRKANRRGTGGTRRASAFLPVVGEIRVWDDAGRICGAVCGIATEKTVQAPLVRCSNGATS